MMTLRLLSFLTAASALVIACSEDEAPGSSMHRFYEHALKNCTPNQLVNCTPLFELCEDGSAFVMVTDIVNDGTYIETATGITFTPRGPGDVPDSISLTFDDEGAAATDDWKGWSWTLNAEPAFSMCDS